MTVLRNKIRTGEFGQVTQESDPRPVHPQRAVKTVARSVTAASRGPRDGRP
jgi:hypothetical protein